MAHESFRFSVLQFTTMQEAEWVCFAVALNVPINILFDLFLQNLFNFVFNRETELEVEVDSAAAVVVVDLVPLLLSEQMFKIIVNSMKNKHH